MERHRRHCWECRRRCVVCDFAVPSCKRCSAAGVECPGYGDAKPVRLTWLAPGRITSRSRGRRKENNPHRPGSVGNTPDAGTHLYVPRLELRTEVCALPQAAEYFNSCIYADLVPIHDLGWNPHIYRLTASHLRAGAASPDYLRFGMVCVTLSHRLNRTRDDRPSGRALAERFYVYWGLAVRSLSAHLDGHDTGDLVIAGILTLLLADVQNGSSLDWRCHVQGVHRIIALRGGFRAVASSSNLEPLLLVFWSVAVLGNTTCPASHLAMTAAQLDALDLVLERFAGSVSPFQMCPLPLFAEMIRVNDLRARARRTGAAAATLSEEAEEVLRRVESFSPSGWASRKAQAAPSSEPDWELVGTVYRSAVAMYATLSLQSLGVLPPSAPAWVAEHLRTPLEDALASPRLKRFMVWPLVVLGVGGAVAERAFVAGRLPGLSRELGTHVPLTAKMVLERFWASGETGWDACFDRAYVFTTQVAVDTSRLSLYDEC